MINRTDPVIKNPTLQSVTWDLLSLGIALNKGVLRDLSILSIVNFRVFSIPVDNALTSHSGAGALGYIPLMNVC